MPFKNPEEQKAYFAKYRSENKEKISETKKKIYKRKRLDYLAKDKKNYPKRHAQMLMLKYGITIEFYNELLVKQGNVCQICKKPETRPTSKNLVVDHCHSTGKIRGLLCSKCNAALGFLKDDIILLNNCIEYLKESKK